MVKRVVILGAGPAGLSAALELAGHNVQVDIIEAEPSVGGLCRSTRKGDFIFDLGGHRFFTKDNFVLKHIKALMNGELIIRPRQSAIWLENKFFTYPLELTDVIKKMHPSILLKSLRDLFMARFVPPAGGNDISFKDWVVKRFGITMYNIYFSPYSRKLWGQPPEQISSDWAAQRISLINIIDVFLRALGREKDAPRTYARKFLYPKTGIGCISEYMAKTVEKKHGKIHLNARVTKIVLKDEEIKEIIYTQDNKQKSILADFTVSTIPLPEFISNIEPKTEDRYACVAETMKFRSIKLVHIMLNKEYVSGNTWIYIPEKKYIFFRIQDRKNWSPTVVPQGKNALTLEIACSKGDAVWNTPDEEIFRRCIKDLEEMRLVREDMVTDYFVEKAEHAYPVYSLDYRRKINTIYNLLSGIKDFISIGRQGLYRYNNMDHSIRMGILAARYIMNGYPREKILETATDKKVFDEDFSDGF